jgi:ADP-heptose:LPS heptosyltransferase
MLGQRGFDTAVLLMPGEAARLPTDVGVTRVERSFEALVAAIAAADVIISSDSLPAHIAGYVGRPMFVVTPEFNRYWLPSQAFSADSTATFDDLRPVARWLETLG